MSYRILYLVVFIFISSCAFGQKTNYSDGFYTLTSPSYSNIEGRFAVVDKRPYVLDKSHSSTFTGISRSLNGIPYSMHTLSNKPLSEDLAELFRRSFEKINLKFTPIGVKATDTMDVVVAAITSDKKPGLLFVLNHWKTDGYINANFGYDVDIIIYDENGNKLAQDNQKGNSVIYAPGSGQPTLGSLIEVTLNNLINSPEISKALIEKKQTYKTGKVVDKQQPNTKSKGSLKGCSAEKILKLKKIGIEDEEILESCK